MTSEDEARVREIAREELASAELAMLRSARKDGAGRVVCGAGHPFPAGHGVYQPCPTCLAAKAAA